jgi:hypothetical protein
MARAVAKVEDQWSLEMAHRQTAPGLPSTERHQPRHPIVGPCQWVVEQVEQAPQQGQDLLMHRESERKDTPSPPLLARGLATPTRVGLPTSGQQIGSTAGRVEVTAD